MKKKIILFLTFLLTAMFLTSCATQTEIEPTKIQELDNIANEIAINGLQKHTIPEEYDIKENKKDKERITISYLEEGNRIVAEYRIANGIAERIRIYFKCYDIPIFIIVVILSIIAFGACD